MGQVSITVQALAVYRYLRSEMIEVGEVLQIFENADETFTPLPA